MSFHGEAFDKKNHNYKPKCFYLINLIKQKNPNVWTRLYEKFKSLKPDESYEFYQLLLKEYKQLEENGWKDTRPVEVEKPQEFHVTQYVNPERKTTKKEPVKKMPKMKAKDKKEKKEDKPEKKVEVKAAKKKVTTKLAKSEGTRPAKARGSSGSYSMVRAMALTFSAVSVNSSRSTFNR